MSFSANFSASQQAESLAYLICLLAAAEFLLDFNLPGSNYEPRWSLIQTLQGPMA